MGGMNHCGNFSQQVQHCTPPAPYSMHVCNHITTKYKGWHALLCRGGICMADPLYGAASVGCNGLLPATLATGFFTL